MPPVYRAADVESEIYERWLAADVFAPDGRGSRADDSKPPFVITQPPPNVTGALHIGHALTGTVEDVMIRRARMQGHPTLLVPGVDHACIAAQFVLDRIIAAEGETRSSLGRERYLERMWQFINADARRHRRPAAPAGHLGRLEPPALHDGRGLGRGRARRLQAAVRRRPRVSRREAHQLVPGRPDQPVGSRGHRDADQGDAVVRPVPLRRRARPADCRTRRSRSPRRGPRRSLATPPWPFIRTTRATRPRSAGAS